MLARSMVFAVALLLQAGWSSTASAVYIDWTGAAGEKVAQTGSYTDASLGEINIDSWPGPSSITWSEGFGLGVDCYAETFPCTPFDNPNEIDLLEVVSVYTDPIDLESITVSNLNVEAGWRIRVDGGFIWGENFSMHFTALESDSDGWATIGIGQRDVSWWRITAELGLTDDFTWAGFEATASATGGGASPVPEPGGAALFLAGLGIVALALRKHAH